jgi:alpha-galactosidase
MRPAITIDEATGTILLTAADTGYALRVDRDAGTVRTLHWGAAVTPEDARRMRLPDQPANSFHSPLDGTEELPVDGQIRFAPPALEARYADGTGALEPSVDDVTAQEDDAGATLVVRLHDRARPLAWELHYRVHRDSPVIERHTVYRHTGDADGEPVLLTRHASAQWNLPVLDSYRLTGLHGRWAHEFQLRRSHLPVGETTLTSRRGHTSHHANPWAALDGGHATEDHGEVWTIALATSGSWRTTTVHTPEGRCSVITGAGHEGVEISLGPGDTWTTPTTTGHYTPRGFGGASRISHTHIRRHVLPHPRETRPVLYNSWEATGFDVTPGGQRHLADLAARIGAELFVVDDGWFAGRDHDGAGLGDWTPHPRRFPDGLGPLADHVHALGMRFGVWVEPEMVSADSDLYRRHPDWTLHLPDRTPHSLRHQYVLDFTRPEVVAWARSWLGGLIESTDADFLKWDFNRSFTEAGALRTAPATRRVHIDHARAVHALMDELRTAYPKLRIEGCAGGGGRVDLAGLARTDQVWPSDNTDAVARLAIQDGFTHAYPPQTMGAWVTDSPNPLTRRPVPLRFRLHAAMAGCLGVGGNLADWSEDELDETARYIAAYKRVRTTIQQGEHYRIGTAGHETSWATQYVSSDRSRAVALQWRTGPETGRAVPPLRLRGLDPQATYRVTDDTDPDDPPALHSGASLMAHGVPNRLPAGHLASRMLTLERQPDRA